MVDAIRGSFTGDHGVQRLGTLTLFRGAIDRVIAGGWPMLAIAAALLATLTGLRYGLLAATSRLPVGADRWIANLIYFAFTSAVSGLGYGLALRRMLTPEAALRGADRPLLEGVALLAGALFAIDLMSLAYDMSVRGAFTGGHVLGVGWIAAGYAAAFGLVAYVLLRLTVWPISRLLGRPMTLAAAWRTTRRAVRGMLLSYLLWALPVMGVVIGASAYRPEQFIAFVQAGQTTRSVGALAVFAGVAVVFGLFSQGQAATVYDLRVGARSVADLFD